MSMAAQIEPTTPRRPGSSPPSGARRCRSTGAGRRRRSASGGRWGLESGCSPSWFGQRPSASAPL